MIKSKTVSLLTIVVMAGSLISPLVPTQSVKAADATSSRNVPLKAPLDNHTSNTISSFQTSKSWGSVFKAGEQGGTIRSYPPISYLPSSYNHNVDLVSGYLTPGKDVYMTTFGNTKGNFLPNVKSSIGSGVIYHHAFYYHDLPMNSKPIPVDLKITLKSYYNDVHLQKGQNTGSIFNRSTPSVAISGRSYARFSFKLEGVPKGKKFPFTVSGIGYDQYMRLRNEKLYSAKDIDNTTAGAANRGETYVGNPSWVKALENNTVTGTRTVGPYDPKGAMTFSSSNNDIDLTLGNGANPEQANLSRMAESTQNNEGSANGYNPYDDRHAFNFSNNFQLATWSSEANTLVSSSRFGNYQSQGSFTRPGQDYWIRTKSASYFASAATHAGTQKRVNNLTDGLSKYVIRNRAISEGLDVQDVRVYLQDYNGGPYSSDYTYMFNIGHGIENGHKVITATLKSKYAKVGSPFYGKIVNLMIHVKPNEALRGTQRQGSSLVSPLYTKGEFMVDFGRGTQNWISTGSGATAYASAKKGNNGGSAHVYAPDPNHPDKYVESDVNTGSLLPGESTKLGFSVDIPKTYVNRDKNIQRRFKDGTLTIKFPSEFEKVSKAKFGINENPNHDAKINGKTVTIDLKDYARKLDNGGKVRIEIEAKVSKNASYKANPKVKVTGSIRDELKHWITDYSYDEKSETQVDKSHWQDKWITGGVKQIKSGEISLNIAQPETPVMFETAYANAYGSLDYPLPASEIVDGQTYMFVVQLTAGYYGSTIGDHYRTFELNKVLPKGFQMNYVDAYHSPANKENSIRYFGPNELNATYNKTSGTLRVRNVDEKGGHYILIVMASYHSLARDVDTHATGRVDQSAATTVSSSNIHLPAEVNYNSITKDLIRFGTNSKLPDKPSGRNDTSVWDPGTAIANPRHTAYARYKLTFDNHTGNDAVIEDDLPKNVSLVNGSVTGTIGITSQDQAQGIDVEKTSKGYEFKPWKWEPSGTPGHYVKGYATYKRGTIEFTVKINPESDWSDYYNANYGRMHYNTYKDKVTSYSYLDIPNTAKLKVSEYVDEAHFRMGVQLFRSRQVIAQDNSQFTRKLNPSHYAPYAHDKVSSDKKAITTAVVYQMPNYMKLDNLQVGVNPESHGFDKGWSTIGRATGAQVDVIHNTIPSGNFVGKNAVITNWNLQVRDFEHDKGSNLGLSTLGKANLDKRPYISNDWGQPVNSRFDNDSLEEWRNKQTPSGRTYIFEQKFNAKTRYYHDYHLLNHMNAKFDSEIRIKGHSIGDRINDDGGSISGSEHLNQDDLDVTSIHLSNIYAYMMMSSKATYSEDGRTIKYKTYGKQLGLAVDNNHKTSFQKSNSPFITYDDQSVNPENQPIVTYVDGNQHTGGWRKLLKMHDNVGNGEERVIETTESSPASNTNNDEGYSKTGYKTKKDDNARFDGLNVNGFWKKSNGTNTDTDGNVYKNGELMPRNIAHGYVSGSTLTERKGHSVFLTITRVDPREDETLTSYRQLNVQYQPYKRIIIGNTASHNTIDSQGFRLVRVKANQTATNPKKFITYYDFNHDFAAHPWQATRVLYESYMLDAPTHLTAKAGNNVAENRKLKIFRVGENEASRKTKLNDFRTNISDKDNIFDNGNIINANDESLNAAFSTVRDDNLIDRELLSSGDAIKKGNSNTKMLLGGNQFISKPGQTYELTQAREKWRPLVPNYHLEVVRFKFNQRVLDHGKQAFANDGVEFRDFNKNIGGYSYDKNGVTLGGNRNYLRRDLKQGGKYVLNLRTTTSNKGLMGNYGFGIGYATSINFDQPLEITGHRIMEKQYNANKGRGTDQYGSSVKDDLSLVPVISGRTGQKIQGFSQADQNWLDRNAY